MSALFIEARELRDDLALDPAIFWLITGTPSITKRGLLLAAIEPIPLILICCVAPGVPEVVLITRPGILPWRAWSMEVTGISLSSSADICTVDPVIVFLPLVL
ncbi:hypothetical protein ES705_42581 [subsurface metagenome]